ncbi:purine and uridine phosphorylase [Viridothelium virens]|uniref:Purine and uridine phosphorylase n=1 Tax=Viridothelium virens TaxID=1048519 RepID=A0A6A6HHT4_VIRVR|nr:purine and uridine phosphorylase [Viridothelium virens]
MNHKRNGIGVQPQAYTIGLICTLPVELAAMRLLLDVEYQEPCWSLDGTNIYTFGSMAGHDVVLACLPAGQYGNSSAAIAAAQMRLNFGSIRFALLVGIGGGVPSPGSDVRLGDVVVSQPRAQHGGVVQYDMGKAHGPGNFERTGYLQPPSTVPLNAISKLQSTHFMGLQQYRGFLSTICQNQYFARPKPESDILFEADTKHTGPKDCSQCLQRYGAILRRHRPANHPLVHYGTIASGNRVIRDGIIRDKISTDLGGVLCFEMEAAGLMNIFPCLVIRGISDYADSHKNDKWQPHAAATAAAYAKEILTVIPPA